MFGKKISRKAAAIVTGAGSGLGRAFTLEVAARGGRVVCADIKPGTADRVARDALDGLDKGRLYVLPQLDARLIWRAKRYLPAGYARGLGWLGRMAGAKRKSNRAAMPEQGVN